MATWLLDTHEPAASLAFPRGLPRPRADGRPIPWTADHWPDGTPRWRQVNVVRQAAAVLGRLCAVCGMALGDTAVIAGSIEGWSAMDAACHPRPCWDMTLASCPGIASNMHQIAVHTVPTAELTVWLRSDGRPFILMPGATAPY